MSDEKVQKHTRNRLLIILSIITLVSIIFFIASTCYICSRDGFKKEIKIVQDGTTIDSLEIKSLNMHLRQNLPYRFYFIKNIHKFMLVDIILIYVFNYSFSLF